MSAKRFNVLAGLGSGAHHAFERRAGVGVFLEPWLGRRRTDAFWSVAIPFWVWRAARGTEREAPLLAFNAGVAIAGATVHFVEWPWSRRLGVLPWLDEAEGLPPEQLALYNTILWLWMAGGVGSLLFETRREHRKWVAAGIATGPLLLASARHHFVWAREQARRDPARWSAALLEESVSARTRALESDAPA
jgi:hypothetical protein